MECRRVGTRTPRRRSSAWSAVPRLALSCSHCGTELPASTKFFLECGERVTP
jgi:hypothetical protein